MYDILVPFTSVYFHLIQSSNIILSFYIFVLFLQKEIQMMAQSRLGAKENCAIADEKLQNVLPTPNWTCGEGWVKYVPCCQWEYFDNQTIGN